MWLLTLSLCLVAEPERLTDDGREKFDPVFLHNGTEIIYTLQETPAQTRIMKRFANGQQDKLHPTAGSSEFEPTFNGDDSWYAFIQSRGNLNLKLVIREVKTGKENSFDPGGGFASLRRPSFVPDGSRVVFSIPSGNGHAIVSVNAQGQDRKTLTEGGLNSGPNVSPDGKKVVFCSSRDGQYDIYAMNIDGSNVHRVVQTAGADFRPCWSPDGKRIVFTSNKSGNYDLWIVNADGTNLRQLTTSPERDDYATWHPDGKRVVFVGERNGKFDLYLLAVE